MNEVLLPIGLVVLSLSVLLWFSPSGVSTCSFNLLEESCYV